MNVGLYITKEELFKLLIVVGKNGAKVFVEQLLTLNCVLRNKSSKHKIHCKSKKSPPRDLAFFSFLSFFSQTVENF